VLRTEKGGGQWAGGGVGSHARSWPSQHSFLPSFLCTPAPVVRRPRPHLTSAAFDRDSGVKVVLRARPLNALEHEKSGGETCITTEGDTVAVRVAKAEHAGTSRFSFDKVFGPDSTQKQVYDFIGPIAIYGAFCALLWGGDVGVCHPAQPCPWQAALSTTWNPVIARPPPSPRPHRCPERLQQHGVRVRSDVVGQDPHDVGA
jgi:hypothetical protein